MLAGLKIVGCVAFTASSVTLQPISIDQILDDFDSAEGLYVRASDLSANLTNEYPSSVTVWRHDLPLGMFAAWASVALVPSDAVGFIVNRGQAQPQCAYPVNALTAFRQTDGVRDGCGQYPGYENSGSCGPNVTAESFYAAYFNKPQMRYPYQLPWQTRTTWFLEPAVCHFDDITVMLDAQKMLLNRSAVAPTGVTPEEWISNATTSFGLTAFNEVIIGPTDGSEFGGIFWAHSGPFRDPLPSDRGACQIAQVLSSDLTISTLPIFELAGVNLERPFQGCGRDRGPFSRANPNCLSDAVAEWNANLTAGGGKRDASSVIREVNVETFMYIDCSDVQVV